MVRNEKVMVKVDNGYRNLTVNLLWVRQRILAKRMV